MSGQKSLGPKYIRYCFKTLFGPKKLPGQLVQSKSLYVLQKICEGMDPTNYDTVLPKLRWRVAGWVLSENNTTSWPNLQVLQESKQVGFQVGPSVAIFSALLPQTQSETTRKRIVPLC